MSGCTMPCSRMESASSRSASAEKSLRGWSGQGRIRSSGTRWTCSRVSGAGAGTGVGAGDGAPGAGAGWVRTGLPPSNAPRPRPKAGFAMRAECQIKSNASSLMSKVPNPPNCGADFRVGFVTHRTCGKKLDSTTVLTPALSSEERGKRSPSFGKFEWARICRMVIHKTKDGLRAVPSPGGEGQVEGGRQKQTSYPTGPITLQAWLAWNSLVNSAKRKLGRKN